MMRFRKEQPYELRARMLIMDCRVKPGNDAECVARASVKLTLTRFTK
jgi:hypothetical protein